MTIQERRCPRCGIRRTVRLGHWGSVCFNCKLGAAKASAALTDGPPANYRFTPAELERLEIYRAAIRAGLYSDWPR